VPEQIPPPALNPRKIYERIIKRMGDIISTVSEVVTAAAAWAAQFGNMIVTTPILLLFVCIPLVGLGVGLFKRLLRVS